VGIHFEGRHLPELLAQRLEQVAGPANGRWTDCTSSSAIRGFLAVHAGEVGKLDSPAAGTKVQDFAGGEISFDDPKLRVWMDNLFLEGVLRPVENPPDMLPRPWCMVGVAKATPGDDAVELAAMRERLVGKLLMRRRLQGWLHFATATRHTSRVLFRRTRHRSKQMPSGTIYGLR
jgi:hypothetical protein